MACIHVLIVTFVLDFNSGEAYQSRLKEVKAWLIIIIIAKKEGIRFLTLLEAEFQHKKILKVFYHSCCREGMLERDYIILYFLTLFIKKNVRVTAFNVTLNNGFLVHFLIPFLTHPTLHSHYHNYQYYNNLVGKGENVERGARA